jgi:Glycosyl hydrolase family 12
MFSKLVTGTTVASAAGSALLALGAAQPAAAASAGHPARVAPRAVLCGRYQHITTKANGVRYVVRNDDYGHRGECIATAGRRPDFTVIRSGARIGQYEPAAYPNVFYGCSWGICTARSGLPRRVDTLRSLVTSWTLAEHAAGRWGAGYDIWFDRVRRTSGQSHGAELMIWLNSRGFGRNTWPVVVVGNARYHLAHWKAGPAGQKWNYIQFRAVRPTAKVKDLSVLPFIRVAERDGFIRPRWWLTSVEAGFEIWKGGVGLGTRSFSVRA